MVVLICIKKGSGRLIACMRVCSAAGRAARYKKQYSVLSFLLIKDWIPYQVRLQGISFLLVRECNRNSLIICYIFFGVRPLNIRHGFPEYGIDSVLRESLPPIKGTNSKEWVPNKEGNSVAFP